MDVKKSFQIEQLENFRMINSELKALNSQIKNTYNTYHSPAIGNGRNSVPGDPTARAIEKLSKLQDLYSIKYVSMTKLLDEIETWINTIENTEIRSIIRWHYLLGLSWKQTSKKVYGYNSYYNARKAFYRFMGKEK